MIGILKMEKFLHHLKVTFSQSDVTKKLIYINIVVAVAFLFLKLINAQWFEVLLSFTGIPFRIEQIETRFWTLLTYTFVHADIFHLLFNMLMLFWVGKLFTIYFTQIQQLGLYILGGFFAGLVYLLCSYFFNIHGILIGASASIMALLFALVTYVPNFSISLIVFKKVKLWQFAFAIILLNILQFNSGNLGGNISHLAGALFGFLYIKLLHKGTDLSQFLIWIQRFNQKSLKPQKVSFKNIYKNKSSENKKEKSLSSVENQIKTDKILDKIKKTGYESLTNEEKAFLFAQK